MDQFISLTCPNCGGSLQITPDIERFVCAYCHQEQLVIRGSGTIYLKPVLESISKVQAGVDKTVSELAINRIKEEIKILEDQKFTVINSYKPPFENSVELVILFVIAAISSILIITNKFQLCAAFGLIISLGLSALIFIVRFKSISDRENELEKIGIEIKEKMKELEYHRNIVSNH